MTDKQFSGLVVHGNREGSELGFPTANLDLEITPQDLEPGVYAGQCQVLSPTARNNDSNSWLDCIVYFGPRLIHGEEKNNFEVHIFDFDTDIYGQKLNIKLWKMTRPPQKFDSFDDLKEQLKKDIELTKKILSTG